MDSLDPALFIGSSTEGLTVARAFQAELDNYCEPTLWSQGVFEAGGTTISDLLAASQSTDFAVLLLTPDDIVETRGKNAPVARDNVILSSACSLVRLALDACSSSIPATWTFAFQVTSPV